jgi:muramoyltetrapeptide carboxypeptidase
MLRRLADGGKIAVCNGVILGTFVRCGEECKDPVVRRQRLDIMVRGILEPFRKPLLANVRSGHGMPMATLPLGVEVEFDAAALDACLPCGVLNVIDVDSHPVAAAVRSVSPSCTWSMTV